MLHEQCVTCAAELVTTPEQTAMGFIEAALARSENATPYVAMARELHDEALKAKSPRQLLRMPLLRNYMLTAAGLSDKAFKYFDEAAKTKAITQLVEKFLEPAGPNFVDELVCRYLLTKGDSLGGQMRNIYDKLAKIQLMRNILVALNFEDVGYETYSCANDCCVWQPGDYEEDFRGAALIKALSWRGKQRARRVLFFDTTIGLVGKNIDLCLYRGDGQDYLRGLADDRAIMFGELKGGIDPAGADEHWKTGNTALTRIRTAFNSRGIDVKTSFVAAAIAQSMAQEIWAQLQSGTLSYAANLTNEDQLRDYSHWIINL